MSRFQTKPYTVREELHRAMQSYRIAQDIRNFNRANELKEYIRKWYPLRNSGMVFLKTKMV